MHKDTWDQCQLLVRIVDMVAEGASLLPECVGCSSCSLSEGKSKVIHAYTVSPTLDLETCEDPSLL